jgi:hypothetical protein
MNRIGRLAGLGTLVADGKEFSRVEYAIDIWRADSGIESARGKLSVSPEVGPAKLMLAGGKEIKVFITTSGVHGATLMVSGAIPRTNAYQTDQV